MSHPEIALELFSNKNGGPDENEFSESYDSISMTIEEIIEFLGRIEEEANPSNATAGRARAPLKYQDESNNPA